MNETKERPLLGNYLKDIERENTEVFQHGKPIYARLDGKGFSKFTKGMNRPYDQQFIDIMVSVAKELIETTRADLAYVQSDEISLYWEPMTCMDFAGRKEKWVGELAGLATAKMMKEVHERFPDRVDKLPRFDCRVFNVTEEDAFKFFLWRHRDCLKNSVSMVTYNNFSHKSMQYVTTSERIERLQEIGDPWEAYPDQFRFGTFIHRKLGMIPVDKSKIPEHVHHEVPDVCLRYKTTTYHVERLTNHITIQQLVDGMPSL